MASFRDLYVPGRPFTTAVGLAAGLTRRQIEGPDFRRVRHGVHVATTTPDTLIVRCRAARLSIPRDAVFSHWTAARLWAPSAPTTSAMHVSFGRNAFARADGVRTHRFTYAIGAVYRHGLPVTSAEQTFVHMAVHLDLVDLVALGDLLVRRSGVTPGDLRKFAARWGGHGGRRARDAARFVRARVDSQPESRLRMLLVLAGLSEPTVNHSVEVHGVERYRLDLAYVDEMVAIEYDGRWHERPGQRPRDDARRLHLRELGWEVVVVTADDLYSDPDALLERVVEVAGRPGVACPPRTLDEYRPYFLPSWTVPSNPGDAVAPAIEARGA
jgi:very-short-patch-repair endonuclease